MWITDPISHYGGLIIGLGSGWARTKYTTTPEVRLDFSLQTMSLYRLGAGKL